MPNVDTHPNKKHVLIVDDCPLFRKLLSSLLAESFCVQAASSGEEAIELLNYSTSESATDVATFDLVITDFDMPGLNGFDVAEHVRGKNRSNKFTPVIMLTGVEVSSEEAKRHGCAAFIPKTDLDKVRSLSRILVLKSL